MSPRFGRHLLMPPLTPQDITFLTDPRTYSSGPTLDIAWQPPTRADLPALRAAILSDHTILSNIPGVSPAAAPDLTRIVWLPETLAPIGLTLGELENDRPEIHAFIYPPHVRRATRTGHLGEAEDRHPAYHALYAAAIALTRRVHARAPLLRARIFDEARDTDITATGVIALPLPIASAAGWPHATLPSPPGLDHPPRVALLPLHTR